VETFLRTHDQIKILFSSSVLFIVSSKQRQLGTTSLLKWLSNRAASHRMDARTNSTQSHRCSAQANTTFVTSRVTAAREHELSNCSVKRSTRYAILKTTTEYSLASKVFMRLWLQVVGWRRSSVIWIFQRDTPYSPRRLSFYYCSGD
jgi:hypothetical protein